MEGVVSYVLLRLLLLSVYVAIITERFMWQYRPHQSYKHDMRLWPCYAISLRVTIYSSGYTVRYVHHRIPPHHRLTSKSRRIRVFIYGVSYIFNCARSTSLVKHHQYLLHTRLRERFTPQQHTHFTEYDRAEHRWHYESLYNFVTADCRRRHSYYSTYLAPEAHYHMSSEHVSSPLQACIDPLAWFAMERALRDPTHLEPVSMEA